MPIRFTYRKSKIRTFQGPDRRRLRPLKWDDDTLAELAEVGTDDLDDMRFWWQERAAPRWKNLLEAEAIDPLKEV